MKKYKKLSSVEKEEIIKKHFKNNISQVKLAEDYNTNRTTISIICRNHDQSPLLKDYKIDDQQIIKMYTEDKMSVLQISKKFGVSTRPIRRRLRLAGIVKKVSKRDEWSKTISHYHLKMKIWTAKVIDRDNMMCKECGCENTFTNKLQAHHITPVRDIENPELLFDLLNGITLCMKCHYKIHFHEKDHEIKFRNLIKTRSSV